MLDGVDIGSRQRLLYVCGVDRIEEAAGFCFLFFFFFFFNDTATT